MAKHRRHNNNLNLATAKERSCLDQPFLKVEYMINEDIVNEEPEIIVEKTKEQLEKIKIQKLIEESDIKIATELFKDLTPLYKKN